MDYYSLAKTLERLRGCTEELIKMAQEVEELVANYSNSVLCENKLTQEELEILEQKISKITHWDEIIKDYLEDVKVDNR